MKLEQRPVMVWHLVDGDFVYSAEHLNNVVSALLMDDEGRGVAILSDRLRAYLVEKGAAIEHPQINILYRTDQTMDFYKQLHNCESTTSHPSTAGDAISDAVPDNVL